ncbi:peptidase domain-containing ABC transporter [Streptococcus uberis]|uniref:peptidase domain-containing ABC transporter n=1 Tax=Streptococcus uberis TaxID=1349 RepID=UPI0019395CCB|nr:peptide cleavage/export ABC transporter [Streptococcus uberis]
MFFKNKIFKFYPQFEAMDCGVACTQMILKYYESNVSTHKLRALTGTTKFGVSIFGLENCFKALNFNTKSLKANSSIWHNENIVYPLIANVHTPDGISHFVVIYKRKNNTLYIADPSKRKYTITINEFDLIWTKFILLVEPNPDYEPRIDKENGLFYYLPMVFESKKLILKIAFLSFIVTIITIVGTFYFQIMLDKIIPSKNINFINIFSIGLIFTYFVSNSLDLIKNNLLIILGIELNRKIVSKYFSHVLSLPMSFFSNRATGDIFSRFLDGSRIIDALASSTLSIILDLTMAIIISITLFFKNKTLFCISLLLIPLYFLIVYIYSKKFEFYSQKTMKTSNELNSEIIESLNGIETIKSYQKEKFIFNKISKNLDEFLEATTKNNKLESTQSIIKNFVDLFISALVLWTGSIMIVNNNLTIGELIAFNSLLSFFTNPIQNIVNLQGKLQNAEIASLRIGEIFNIYSENIHDKSLKIIENISKITIQNFNFSYSSDKLILKNINCTIEKNNIYSIVGKSGSGKSSLAQALVNFYPTEKQIFVDEKPIEFISKSSLREIITYVPQDVFIFNGSLKENILFGLSRTVNKNEIIKVCKIAEIYDFIESLPYKFNTIIEENGANLSGGQKKRIALARALLRDSSYYIFDEITSGLDSQMEKKIITNINSLPNKTLIYITHSDFIEKSSDYVFTLSNGELR